MNLLKKVVIFLGIFTHYISPSAARSVNYGNREYDDLAQRSVQDLMTVGFTGLAGGVIGLSTLSFIDRPGDHLSNIVVGTALGIILGVGLVAYGQAVDTYQSIATRGGDDDRAGPRSMAQATPLSAPALSFSWQWQF